MESDRDVGAGKRRLRKGGTCDMDSKSQNGGIRLVESYCTTAREKMQKLNLVKTYKSYYKAGKKPEVVEFGEINY